MPIYVFDVPYNRQENKNSLTKQLRPLKVLTEEAYAAIAVLDELNADYKKAVAQQIVSNTALSFVKNQLEERLNEFKENYGLEIELTNIDDYKFVTADSPDQAMKMILSVFQKEKVIDAASSKRPPLHPSSPLISSTKTTIMEDIEEEPEASKESQHKPQI